MADLDPGYRRELAEQIEAAWQADADEDLYGQLVDELLELGWAMPPKWMPPKPMPPQDPGVNG